MSADKRTKLAAQYCDKLVTKSLSFRRGFLDRLLNIEKEYPRSCSKIQYVQGVKAADKIDTRNRKKAALAENMRSLPHGSKALPHHTDYQWIIRRKREDSAVMPVSHLTEIEAKDALCDCLNMIAKLRDATHAAYIQAKNFLE